MKIAIEMSYTITSHNVVELPVGKTWSDVKDYFPKHGTLVLTFKDGTEFHAYGGYADIATIDFKYPNRCLVFPANDGCEAEYEKAIGDWSL